MWGQISPRTGSVDLIAGRSSGKMIEDILDGETGHGGACLTGCAADMGQKHDI